MAYNACRKDAALPVDHYGAVGCAEFDRKFTTPEAHTTIRPL
jgi:hypothetical protein